MRVRTRVAACLAAAALAATGCGSDPAPGTGAGVAADGSGPVTLRDATLRPGQPVPAATGRTLFTVTGISGGPGLPVDRGLLGRLTQVQLQVYEPWVKKDLGFRGVWLADLLAVAGMPAGTGLRLTALDDYTATLTAADLSAGGILLATSDAAGAEIPVDEGGPTRIVFQEGTAAGRNADQWIWSLRTLEVR